MKNSILKNGLTLALYALTVTAMIAITHLATKDTIAQQEQQKLLSILNAIIDPDSYTNNISTDCAIFANPLLGNDYSHKIYRARQNDTPVAAAIETIALDGYNGKIKIVVGVKADGTVSGVRVLEHKETPGLGDKIDLRVSNWILSFNDMTLNQDNASRWAVKKDGGQFDQFTGATITPRAVVNTVKQAIEFFKLHQTSIFATSNSCDDSAQKSETE